MHFQIHKLGELTGVPGYSWTLEKKEGRVCQSAQHFDSEKEARSDIASAKKPMKGAMRAKVLSP